jgi:hypothetical protein
VQLLAALDPLAIPVSAEETIFYDPYIPSPCCVKTNAAYLAKLSGELAKGILE